MNKQEKFIVVLLGLVLAGWLWHTVSTEKERAAQNAEAQRVAAATASTPQSTTSQSPTPQSPNPQSSTSQSQNPKSPNLKSPNLKSSNLKSSNLKSSNLKSSNLKSPNLKSSNPVKQAPERLHTLANDEAEFTLSSHGAVVKSGKLLKYGTGPGVIDEKNPALKLDFSVAPVLALEGLEGVSPEADFEIAEKGADFVLFRNSTLSRRITLRKGYLLEVEESFANPSAAANRLSLGAIAFGSSKNDLLSIDAGVLDAKQRPQVVHYGETEPLKSYLVSTAGGCGGSRSAAGMRERNDVPVNTSSEWLAVKNRFFTSALVKSTERNVGFTASMFRNLARQDYALDKVSASVQYASVPAKRGYTLYIGPKKQSILWDLGMKDVMEFGMWRWLCYPVVWVLNFLYGLIPNYGVAIILLTILARLLFWPLTHKSTVGMRRMQEIQPKVKAVQQQFKDNPQRMQQEIWAIYRENKVNPLSSCLPMLVQIPIFIALFNVLRSSVELRYAPFLWIADLSEPEALFASWFPFGGLNILPILMAVLTVLQTAFSPSAGDNRQQRMMMFMMPAMMLFFFYNFPSALSLYWMVSTFFGVVQAWWIKRRYGAPAATTNGVIEPDEVIMPTRQMRRHGGR